MKQCPKCNTVHDDSVVSCDCGHTFPVKAHSTDLLGDVLAFPWIPIRRTTDSSQYWTMGARGTVLRIFGLIIANAVAVVIGLFVLIGGNPYIDLADDLHHFPFDLAWVFLMLISFLVHTTAHFVCFRILSGKGNLVSHAYLSALSTTSHNALYWLTIGALYVTRIKGVDLAILVIGGLYLLYPSIVSLKVVHRVSVVRAIVGFVLSIVVSIPLFVLYLYLFVRLREGYPYEIYDWRLSFHLGAMLLVGFSVLVYMLEEKWFSGQYPDGVPMLEPVKAGLRQRWIQLALALLLVSITMFYLFDIRYPSLYTELPAYSATFLPRVDPDLLYVYTQIMDNERAAIEVWNVVEGERLDIISAPLGHLLRPNRDGLTLVITLAWDVSHSSDPSYVFDPQARKSIGRTGYLGGQDHIIAHNTVTGESYSVAGSTYGGGGYTTLIVGQSTKLNYREIRGPIRAAAVHPSGEFIFVVGDNFVDTLRADTLEVISTIRLGGKLWDLAASPDGQTLYITDALWHRVRVVPSPVE